VSRRTVCHLLGAGALLGLAWAGYAWWRGQAVVAPYHAVELGMPLVEAERLLGVPRNEVGEAYDLYETVHLVEDRGPHGASNHVDYRDGRYLVTLNYDPTAANQPVHRKTLVRIRKDWVRRLGDSLPW
jgi:hypothetical protein